MTDSNPYRSNATRPVCATCRHRVDRVHMDKEQPWRDWACRATSVLAWREEYNPITGITTPARYRFEDCVKVNEKGDCSKYEATPAGDGDREIAETPQPEPSRPLCPAGQSPAGIEIQRHDRRERACSEPASGPSLWRRITAWIR